MFKKQAAFKSASNIRNSERRNLISEVRAAFPQGFEGQSEEWCKERVDSILPSSGIEATAFTSTKGQKGILYTHNEHAIFVKTGSTLLPTLYTIWKCEGLIPTVLTGSQVLPHLQSGSDLMIKGMFEYSSSIKAGDVVGIRVNDRDHIIAIGTAALDFDSITREEGGKGIITHLCLGDTIYRETDNDALAFEAQQDSNVESAITAAPTSQSHPQAVGVSDEKGPIEDEDQSADKPVDREAMDQSAIDEAFGKALLYGMYMLTSTGEESNFSLPVNASTLFDSHVLPYLPRHPDLVIKKSSWKKATKFLSKQKFLKTKEAKGQVLVTSVDWSSSDIRAFVPYRLTDTLDEQSKADDKITPKPGRTPRKIEITEFYKISKEFSPLFGDRLPGETISVQECNDLLQSYYESQKLVTENAKLITLDPHLYHLLGKKTNQKALSRDVLLRNMLSMSTKYYRINDGKVKKGSPSPVSIIMESRQGRKSVTRVAHLEPYLTSAEVDEMADALKKKCAVSVSLGEVKGAKPGTSIEILVQGKKSEEVTEVLNDWGIRKAWLKLEDKTK